MDYKKGAAGFERPANKMWNKCRSVVYGLVVGLMAGSAVAGGLVSDIDFKRGNVQGVRAESNGDPGLARDVAWVERLLRRYYSGITWDAGAPTRYRLSYRVEESSFNAQALEGALFGVESGGFTPLFKNFWLVEGETTNRLDWTTRVCVLVPPTDLAVRSLLLSGYALKPEGGWKERSCGGDPAVGFAWYYKDIGAREGGFATKMGTGLKVSGVKETSAQAQFAIPGKVVANGATSWTYQTSVGELWLSGFCGAGTGGLASSGTDANLLRGWQEQCANIDPEQQVTTKVTVYYEYSKPVVTREGWSSSACTLATTIDTEARRCAVQLQKLPTGGVRGWQAQWWNWDVRMTAVLEDGGGSRVERSEVLSKVAASLGFVVK